MTESKLPQGMVQVGRLSGRVSSRSRVLKNPQTPEVEQGRAQGSAEVEGGQFPIPE